MKPPNLRHQFDRLCWRVLKPITVGVRVLLIQDDTVLLVEHTYGDDRSWCFPGGGVKKRETIETALRREVYEELGAQLGNLTLLGIYSSFDEYKSDHSIIFVCHDFTVTGKTCEDKEVARWGFFPVRQLPSNTSRATRQRIKEYLKGDGIPIVGEWVQTVAQVRKARAGDNAGLARVQVDSYRTAYAGLLPQNYLAHFTYAEQEQDWRDWTSSHPDDLLYVAENNRDEIVGYALARPGLSHIAPYDSELLALHVRRSCQRQGVGRQLLAAVAQQLKQQGCSSLMLWVLEKNPSRLFYERLGGQLIGQQTVHLGEGDMTPIEVAYGWPNIDRVCGSSRFTVDQALLAQARDRLSKRSSLYWLVGGAGSGKTTVCRALSTRLGVPVYDMDAHIYGEYHRRFSPQKHPVNTAWATADNGLAWLLDLSWDEFDSFNRAALPEYLDLLCDDLDALEPGAGVLVDGGISNPALLAQVIPARRIACLSVPGQSSVQVWEETDERKGMKEAVHQLPNPDEAWDKFLEFDRLLTNTMLQECRQGGIPIYSRGKNTSVEELVRRVARKWGKRCTWHHHQERNP